MSESKALSDLEREAAHSWREWPVYVVMRLKRLQAIQSKLRVEGQTPSALIRREALLAAAHDDGTPIHPEPQAEEDYVEYNDDLPVAAPASAAQEATDASEGDYSDDIDYDKT
jgi:hypothetical protein